MQKLQNIPDTNVVLKVKFKDTKSNYFKTWKRY